MSKTRLELTQSEIDEFNKAEELFKKHPDIKLRRRDPALEEHKLQYSYLQTPNGIVRLEKFKDGCVLAEWSRDEFDRLKRLIYAAAKGVLVGSHKQEYFDLYQKLNNNSAKYKSIFFTQEEVATLMKNVLLQPSGLNIPNGINRLETKTTGSLLTGWKEDEIGCLKKLIHAAAMQDLPLNPHIDLYNKFTNTDYKHISFSADEIRMMVAVLRENNTNLDLSNKLLNPKKGAHAAVKYSHNNPKNTGEPPIQTVVKRITIPLNETGNPLTDETARNPEWRATELNNTRREGNFNLDLQIAKSPLLEKKQYDENAKREVLYLYQELEDLGESLPGVLSHRPGNLNNKDEQLSLAIQICLQVAKLHTGEQSKTGAQYLHRDIKPQNIGLKDGKIGIFDLDTATTTLDAEMPIGTGTGQYIAIDINDVNTKNFNTVKGTTSLFNEKIALLRTLYYPKNGPNLQSVFTETVFQSLPAELQRFLDTTTVAEHSLDKDHQDTALFPAAVLIMYQAQKTITQVQIDTLRNDVFLQCAIAKLYEIKAAKKANLSSQDIDDLFKKNYAKKAMSSGGFDVTNLNDLPNINAAVHAILLLQEHNIRKPSNFWQKPALQRLIVQHAENNAGEITEDALSNLIMIDYLIDNETFIKLNNADKKQFITLLLLLDKNCHTSSDIHKLLQSNYLVQLLLKDHEKNQRTLTKNDVETFTKYSDAYHRTPNYQNKTNAERKASIDKIYQALVIKNIHDDNLKIELFAKEHLAELIIRADKLRLDFTFEELSKFVDSLSFNPSTLTLDLTTLYIESGKELDTEKHAEAKASLLLQRRQDTLIKRLNEYPDIRFLTAKIAPLLKDKENTLQECYLGILEEFNKFKNKNPDASVDYSVKQTDIQNIFQASQKLANNRYDRRHYCAFVFIYCHNNRSISEKELANFLLTISECIEQGQAISINNLMDIFAASKLLSEIESTDSKYVKALVTLFRAGINPIHKETLNSFIQIDETVFDTIATDTSNNQLKNKLKFERNIKPFARIINTIDNTDTNKPELINTAMKLRTAGVSIENLTDLYKSSVSQLENCTVKEESVATLRNHWISYQTHLISRQAKFDSEPNNHSKDAITLNRSKKTIVDRMLNICDSQTLQPKDKLTLIYTNLKAAESTLSLRGSWLERKLIHNIKNFFILIFTFGLVKSEGKKIAEKSKDIIEATKPVALSRNIFTLWHSSRNAQPQGDEDDENRNRNAPDSTA